MCVNGREDELVYGSDGVWYSSSVLFPVVLPSVTVLLLEMMLLFVDF